MSTPTVPSTAAHTADAFRLLADTCFDLVSVRSAPELALEVFVRVPTGDDVQAMANRFADSGGLYVPGDGVVRPDAPALTVRHHADRVHTRVDLPFGVGSDPDSPNVMYRAAVVVRVFAVDPLPMVLAS